MADAWLNTSSTDEVQNRTLVLIKPNGLSHWIKIKTKLSAHAPIGRTRLVQVTRELIQDHYSEHTNQPWFEQLTNHFVGKFMLAVELYADPQIIRNLIGPTSPSDEDNTDTIRGLVREIIPPTMTLTEYTKGIDNLIHASDSETAATREINLWFEEDIGDSPKVLSLTQHHSESKRRDEILAPLVGVTFPLGEPMDLVVHVSDFIEALPWISQWSEPGQQTPVIQIGGATQVSIIALEYFISRTGKVPSINWVHSESGEISQINLKDVRDRARGHRVS